MGKCPGYDNGYTTYKAMFMHLELGNYTSGIENTI
jgi:hypothetical protein